jgi:hypothetical protein
MRGLAALALLTLATCAGATGATTSASSEAVGDWQTPAGKPPTKTEFAALVAACQDKLETATDGAPMNGCLTDLGLRRVQ